MKLRGIEFGSAFNASGARNFFGRDAWWFHSLFAPFGLTYKGSTLVTKTTTLSEREGFMPLVINSTEPRSLVPQCIRAYPLKGVVLNKVGLSGHGIDWLIEQGSWQANTEPFVISIMAVRKTKEERLLEIREMAQALAEVKPDFCATFAVQVNFSCPNVGHEQKDMVGEVGETLDILSRYLPGVPLIPKFNALLLVQAAIQVGKHADCDAIVMGNTIPWGQLPDRIDWKGLFGSDTSPLAGFGGDPGGGGLSGAPLLPIHVDWIRLARDTGFKKPIIACGGILHIQDVRWLKDAGADAIEVGSASILRPWRVQGIINEARRVFA